jgi:hypothetical protein
MADIDKIIQSTEEEKKEVEEIIEKPEKKLRDSS